jgi:hypothetical protein
MSLLVNISLIIYIEDQLHIQPCCNTKDDILNIFALEFLSVEEFIYLHVWLTLEACHNLNYVHFLP